MSRPVKIYYGLSGTFKTTTINSNLNLGDSVLWSSIKRWKKWEKDLLENLNHPNDLNLALLHLSRLGDLNFDLSKDDTTLHIERGVSDMLFYWKRIRERPIGYDEDDFVKNIINEELDIIDRVSGGTKEPEKILLIQKDYDFVQNTVLKEPSRSNCFPRGVQDYMDAQDRYISFTKEYNKITSEIVISNAKDYLNGLGIEWENPEINNEN